ncbi:sulfotransferase family protein [Haloactinospora alba]|uniref:Sulfotransferase family protein n=2 Tax=Haloactinospora alba TaxID=405555 RepID=A0A543NIL9_9ACTN|nr:sulfotransferase family protein [Haloactinospora alba]
MQLMLHSHPRIAVPPETRFLLRAYREREYFGDLRVPENRRSLAEWIVGRKKTRFRDLGLAPREIVDEIVAGPPTLGSALGIVFRAYARRFGKPRWGDKRPAYYQNINAIMRLFPDAQIVQLIRDGRDCVGSLKQMPWYRHNSYHAISTWAEAIDYGRSAAARLGPDTFYQVRYESLIADPQRELTALCDFLGEKFDPAMCEPREVADVAVPKRKTWHENTHGAVTQSTAGTWEKRLAPWELQLCESALGSRLRDNGYELSGAESPPVKHWLRYTGTATKRRYRNRKRSTQDMLRRMREPDDQLPCRLPEQQRPGTSEHA